MRFTINFNNKDYSYELGESKYAKEACRGIGIYQEHGDYDDLRKLFFDLSRVVTDGGVNNKHACYATHILAAKVFRTVVNDGQKVYLANCMTSIYAKAHLPIPTSCQETQIKYVEAIRERNIIANQNSSNPHERRLKDDLIKSELYHAGLGCLDLNTRLMIGKPIPKKYSVDENPEDSLTITEI